MTGPQTSANPKDKEREQVVFSTKKVFEICETRVYNEVLGKHETTIRVSINGNNYFIKNSDYDEILKDLRRKIQLLSHINNDSTYESLIEDIMVDIAKLIYKLS